MRSPARLARGIVGSLLGLLVAALALTTSEAADRLDTLIGVGIERYRAESYREAIAVFNSVVASRPDNPQARLYLAVSHLHLGEDQMAERHLAALRGLPISSRLRIQVDHVLEGMHAGPLTPPLRRFIAATLDETMATERSVPPRAFSSGIHSRNFPYFP